MMKKGIYAWYGYDLEPQTALAKMANAGFEATTIWWSDEFFSKETTLRLARDLGLEVVSGHLPYAGTNALWQDGAEGEKYLHWLLSLIEDAGKAGLPILILHPSEGPTPPPISDVGVERFSLLLEKATSAGVRLALENVRSRDHFEHLLQTLPALGICYDSGHNNAVTKDLSLLTPYRERVIAVHLHDNDGVKDLHLLPFEGTIDWPAEMKMLSQTAYDGPLMLESISDGSLEPDLYLQRCIDVLDRLAGYLTHS